MPGVVDMFCNQTLTWYKHKPGVYNEFGETQFEDPVEIPCRVVEREKFLRDDAGETIPTGWAILVPVKMEIGDKFKVDTVEIFMVDVAFSDIIWIDGTFLGRWCFGGYRPTDRRDRF